MGYELKDRRYFSHVDFANKGDIKYFATLEYVLTKLYLYYFWNYNKYNSKQYIDLTSDQSINVANPNLYYNPDWSLILTKYRQTIFKDKIFNMEQYSHRSKEKGNSKVNGWVIQDMIK